MTKADVDVVRTVMEAFARRDAPTVEALQDPEFEFRSVLAGLTGGSYRPGEVERYYADIDEQRQAVPADERLPYVVLLLDRWEGFISDLSEVDVGRLNDRMLGLLREGASVGIHVVVAGDRSWRATLTRRHAQILTHLAGAGPRGLDACALSVLVHGDAEHVVTARAEVSRLRRAVGALVAGAVVVAAVGAAAWFYPVWTARVIPYDAWRLRMWFGSWI